MGRETVLIVGLNAAGVYILLPGQLVIAIPADAGNIRSLADKHWK